MKTKIIKASQLGDDWTAERHCQPDIIFSVEFVIHATAYIRAKSPWEARAIAKKMKGQFAELPTNDCADMDRSKPQVCISNKSYGDPDLPPFSFSPAVTIGKPSARLEVAQDNANREEKKPS